MKKFSSFLLLLALFAMSAVPSFAAVTGATLDVSTLDINLTPFMAVGVMILTAGAAVVVFKKLKGLLGW